jgi:hypothetical protein
LSSKDIRAPTDAAGAWLRIEESELKIAGVTAGTGFGKAVGLRISGRIFAFPNGGELIRKLPTSRVAELIESGAGRPWGPGSKVIGLTREREHRCPPRRRDCGAGHRGDLDVLR